MWDTAYFSIMKKSKKDLSIDYIPIKKSAPEFFQQLVEKKLF